MLNSGSMSSIRSLFEPLAELSARRETIAILLLLAETAIIYIFAGTLLAERNDPHTPLPALLIFVVLLISRLVPHVLNTIRIWSPSYEVVMLCGVIGTMLLVVKAGAFPHEGWLSMAWLQGMLDALILRENQSIRIVWMLIAFVAFAWLRGRTRAEANLETAYSMLRLGVVWMAAAIIFTVAVAPEEATIFSHINAALLGFLVMNLLAIAIARQPEADSAAAWNTSWVWLLVFVLPILVIAMTAVSTVGILTRDTLDVMLGALSPIFWLLQIMVQALVLTIAVVAFILVSPVIWFLERQGFRPLSNFPSLDLSSNSRANAEEFARSTLHIEDPVRYLIVGLILIGLIWFLVRYSFRRRRRWYEDSRPQRESLIEWEQPSLSLVRRARRWLSQHIRTASAVSGPEGSQWAATRKIRHTYQRFLRANRRLDLPKLPAETPLRYADRLDAINPDLQEPTDEIASIYTTARYSGRPATENDADIATAAWKTWQNRQSLDR